MNSSTGSGVATAIQPRISRTKKPSHSRGVGPFPLLDPRSIAPNSSRRVGDSPHAAAGRSSPDGRRLTTSISIRHFLARAADLSDCAALIDMSDDERIYLELRPNNPSSVGVAIGSEAGAEWVTFTDPMSVTDEWRVNIEPESVDHHIDAAVEGRVRALHGPSRGIIEVRRASGGRPIVSHHYGSGLRNLIPRPGWKRRATIINYEPYRRSD